MNPPIEQRIEKAGTTLAETPRDLYHFKKGAEFVLNTILPELLEWLSKQGLHIGPTGFFEESGEGIEITTILQNFKNRDNE